MAKKRAAKVAAEPDKPAKATRPKNTEVEAYGFIRAQLKDLGWTVRDPCRAPDGQVWTQNQCLGHEKLKAAFGSVRPENVVKLSEKLVWVIEAKANRSELQTAIDEATDFYSKKINALPGAFRAVIATGVAGTEEAGYLMRTKVRIDGKWKTVTINKQEATGLLSPTDVERLLADNTADVHDFTPPTWLFVHAAERINGILHEGGINKNDRAKTMAALLLSVIHEPPNLETSLPVLIGEINARSKTELTANDKPAFAKFVEILPPTNHKNHVKFKNALVKTILELQSLNIRSAMNSSTDVLGQFYEVFLKYGNGAKEIGIVLTPRHITRFAVEAVGIGPGDLVLDPACGTGGFLVAAFDKMRRDYPKQIDTFKKHNLFGIEEQSHIAVLAIVNMIFRGDGKHNITEGNAMTTHLVKATREKVATAEFADQPSEVGQEPISRVLMNPPFALKGAYQEHCFVARALNLMADGGLLFALVPLDVMFGAREEKVWRRDDLLRHHTLLSVVTMSDELFLPAALKQVVGIVIKKGFPHAKDQPVFWGRIVDDGHILLKSKRMPGSEMRPPRSAPDAIPTILPLLKSFLANPGGADINMPLLCKTEPIRFDDPQLELLPEAYIDSEPFTKAGIERAADDLAREMASFLIRFRKESLVESLNATN